MKRIDLLPQYPYLFETHMHTCRGSACSLCSPVEMAETYYRAGYTGIVITEHNWGGHTSVPSYLAWPDWVWQFASGYYEAREWAESRNFSVFWGYEAGFNGTEFIVLGLTPEYLVSHPELKSATLEEHHAIVKSGGGFIIHAHPFRDAYYIPRIRLLPDYVDAVEAINATHHNKYLYEDYGDSRGNRIYDLQATVYARKHGFPMTAGSDMHSTRLYFAGMAFATRPTDALDMVQMIRSREGYVLTDGVDWYDESGETFAGVNYR